MNVEMFGGLPRPEQSVNPKFLDSLRSELVPMLIALHRDHNEDVLVAIGDKVFWDRSLIGHLKREVEALEPGRAPKVKSGSSAAFNGIARTCRADNPLQQQHIYPEAP